MSIYKHRFTPAVLSKRVSLVLLLLASLLITSPVSAQEIHPKVASLLVAKEAPEGVVFDIETLEKRALTELAEFIRKQVNVLKQKYPELDIAVVSHGVEEVALQKSEQPKQAKLHNLFSQLVEKSEVSVHVCGAVAGLKNLTQEDFPEFVSYSESGMAQINDYKALGYEVIVIKQLTDSERKQLFANPASF